jgi:hypothetical protein
LIYQTNKKSLVMKTIKLIKIINNTKKNNWFADFESTDGFKITNVKISAEKAKDFIINATNDLRLCEQDNNIIIYNFNN